MMQIELGALAPSLIEQLAGEVDAAILAHLDRDADAITRLYVRGYIAQSVADRARKRLVKEISKEARAAADRLIANESAADCKGEG